MAGDAVAEVKARLDLIEVISGYVSLHRAGRELSGLCPFHPEKTPSFTVNPERQVWYCHGCHEGGDLFKFIEQIERIDFRQALELLADRAGVELESGPNAGRGAGRRRRRSIELNTKAQAYYQHVLWSSPTGEPGRALLVDRGVGGPSGICSGTCFGTRWIYFFGRSALRHPEADDERAGGGSSGGQKITAGQARFTEIVVDH